MEERVIEEGPAFSFEWLNQKGGSPLKQIDIRKTCPCNVNPLIHTIYIVKLGFIGVYNSANRSLNRRYLMNTLLGMVYF